MVNAIEGSFDCVDFETVGARCGKPGLGPVPMFVMAPRFLSLVSRTWVKPVNFGIRWA